jgi:hypothetical protein
MNIREQLNKRKVYCIQHNGLRHFIFCLVYIVVLFVGLMLSIFIYRLNIVPNGVLLGKPIITFLIAAIMIFLFSMTINLYIKIFNFRDFIIISLLTFFINYNLYGHIPFNVARSNSILLLGYFYKYSERPATLKEVSAHIEYKYFVENDAIARRIKEQEKLGHLVRLENGWIITEQGKKTANFLFKFSNLYGVGNDNLLRYYFD